MQTGQHPNALFHDTIATLIAGALAVIGTVFEGVGTFLDADGQRIVTGLTIVTLTLLAIRHWRAIWTGRP